MNLEMTIEIKLPTEIEATIRANEHLDLLIRKGWKTRYGRI
jgi:hypothetical protein